MAATKYFDTENTDQEYYGNIYMQIRESFITTKQSRRVICKDRRTICRLRIDTAIGLGHKRIYLRALEFVRVFGYLSHYIS